MNGETIACLEIPESLQETVWTQLHKDLGHLGIQRTYGLIRRKYPWKGLYKSIVDFNAKCLPCQEVNWKQETYLMQESQLPRYPWDKIAIDTTGLYTSSNNGNKYLITVMDVLNSYPEAYPAPDKSAETAAILLTDNLIPTHSCPVTIISDHCKEYKNRTVKEVCKKFRIERIYTGPDYPQSNGKLGEWYRMLHHSMNIIIQDDEAI